MRQAAGRLALFCRYQGLFTWIVSIIPYINLSDLVALLVFKESLHG